MEKKYILTDETLYIKDKTLHRIKALKSFNTIKRGELGGWVESETNLSQEGDCWIYNDAKVWDNARVLNNAKIYEFAEIYNMAIILDNAQVYGDAKVYGHAQVYGNAEVFGYAKVYGNAKVSSDAIVCENAEIFRLARVDGTARIRGTAKIESYNDYIVFKNWWSSGRYFTWTRSNNMWSVGCFYGTGDELIAKAYKDSKRSGEEYKRIVKYVKAISSKNFFKKLFCNL